MKRFRDFYCVVDYVTEHIDELGFWADDFDCEAIAYQIAVADEDGEHWRVSISERDFVRLLRILKPTY